MKVEKKELIKRAEYLTKENKEIMSYMETLGQRIYELKSKFLKNKKIKMWFNSEDMKKVLKTYKRKNKEFVFLIQMQEHYEQASSEFQENMNQKFVIFDILQGKKNDLKEVIEFIIKVKSANEEMDNYSEDFPF